MLITACVKNRRTKILPQFESPIALLFKDEGVLANHPLSCHPQGVFGSRENERKWEKIKAGGKTSYVRQNLFTGQKVSFYSVYKWLI